MSNALENLVGQAADAAANFQPPAPIQPPSVGAVAPLAKPSLDSFVDGGGMDVDAFIRLNDSGFRFGDKMQGLLEEVIVDIDMTQVTPIISFRYEVGGTTKFLKSYDGQTTSDGQNFQQAVARANAIPGVKASGTYPTVEIPMTLVDKVDDPKKGSPTSFEAGAKIGYTPSVTGAKCFQAFAKKLRSENPDSLRSVIRTKVTHQLRTNAANNRWGVLEFERLAA